MVPFAGVLSLGVAAYGADRADVQPGALTISGDGYSIAVLGRGLPLFEKLFAPGMCRITYVGEGQQIVPQVRECPDALRDEVVPASKYWLFQVEGDATGASFDVWYLIDGRGVTTHLGPNRNQVKGSELPVWDLVPVEVALPEWPAGQTLPARCTVTVTLDKETGHAADVTVADEGCPSGYAPTVLSAARRWVFEPVSTNNVPVPLVFDAVARFSPPSDGADATIDVDLPLPPSAALPEVGAAIPRRQLPDAPPLFRLRHRNYADVVVYGIGALRVPEGTPPGRCDFLMQVNSTGRTWTWPERCPEALLAPLEASRTEWTLVPGKADVGELYARFRGTWTVGADGVAVLQLPESDLVNKPELPPGVETYAVAQVSTRVPPKLPKGFVLGDPQVCVLDVTVGRRGHVTAVLPAAVPGAEQPGGCDPALLTPALKSASRWRWTPAASNGEPFESHASVRVKFGGGA